jgi:hypothetical protein
MRWPGHAARMRKIKMHAKIVVGKPNHRYVNNIKMDYKKIRCDAVDWIQLAQ